ncbi:MAG: DUF4271 domain-containing protein [Prevotellaceae bacterium]|jgi:hypothetical protein|nr:DUF4271 domain-containing protein [Prevotellaceae bacterium]
MLISSFETFKYTGDSLHNSVGDAVAFVGQSSNCQWDTLRTSYVPPSWSTGFEGVALGSSMETSPFVFIGIVALLFLPLLVFHKSKGFLKDSFAMILKTRRRQNTFRSFRSPTMSVFALLSIFFIFSMSLYVFNFSFYESATFSYLKLSLIIVATATFFLVKILFIRFLTYVFFDSTITRVTTTDYLNILSLCGLFIFPILVFRIYANPGWHFYLDILSAIILIVSILLVIVKLFGLFFSKFIDLFYILLYLCTLEILPVFSLLKVYRIIV